MARKPGYDPAKTRKILQVLVQNPDGIWLRQIAEKTGYSPTTVSSYLNNVLKNLIEDTSIGHSSKPILRVIRLKPYVRQKIEEGASLAQITKLLKIIEEV